MLCQFVLEKQIVWYLNKVAYRKYSYVPDNLTLSSLSAPAM